MHRRAQVLEPQSQDTEGSFQNNPPVDYRRNINKFRVLWQSC
jgi:hypothetical protein